MTGGARGWAVLIAGICALGASAPAAQATVAGANGRVAFEGPVGDQGSTLYTANPDGTAVRRVFADATSSDRHPRWSPDSTRLAFAGSGGIFVAGANGGQLAQLTTGADTTPDWSPDGTRIAFSRRHADDHSELFTVAVDGTDLRQVTSDPEMSSRHPRWSPDGSTLLFDRNVGFSLDASMWSVRPDGTDLRLLRSAGFDAFANGEWSPDGTQIVYSRGGCCNQNAHVMNADGSGDRFLVRDAVTPQWSPDGTQVLFINRGDLIGSGRELRPLAVIPVGGGAVTSLNLGAFVFPSWGSAPLLTGDEGDDPALRPQCSNGRDDDLDGRIDFPADHGCSSGIDDFERDRAVPFDCTATAVRSGGQSSTVANPADSPCVDTETVRGARSVGNVHVAYERAATDAEPDDWFRDPPSPGDYGRAVAEVAKVWLRVAGVTVAIGEAWAIAQATCSTSGLAPVPTADSGVGNVVIGDRSVAVGRNVHDLHLGTTTLRFNTTDISSGRITRRAVWVDRPGDADDVILAEASARGFFGTCRLL